jgi:hypothetical protein
VPSQNVQSPRPDFMSHVRHEIGTRRKRREQSARRRGGTLPRLLRSAGSGNGNHGAVDQGDCAGGFAGENAIQFLACRVKHSPSFPVVQDHQWGITRAERAWFQRPRVQLRLHPIVRPVNRNDDLSTSFGAHHASAPLQVGLGKRVQEIALAEGRPVQAIRFIE